MWETKTGFLFIFAFVLGSVIVARDVDGQLVENFYAKSCPNVESIVQKAVYNKFIQTFATIPGTLRLFQHDCFVDGCDASLMIQSPNEDAERDHEDNQSISGDAFDTILKAKEAVEANCPGVVSCADIMALAARDIIVLAKGPNFKVELGRRDGLVSQKSHADGKLPHPDFKLAELNAMFGSNGLTQTDMIALSGAHTIGFSHCKFFANRIHSSRVDPTLDPEYATKLQNVCPANFDPFLVVNMDPVTPRRFDNSYFKELVKKRGLFTSDSVLFEDERSRDTVVKFAEDGREFEKVFVAAMRKLGRVGVKNGSQGEIRRDCRRFNA
uniref:Peroxidase n=1 Tax=Kalanchoe fedtschenkoi TaxID=63787 RepID=A0A7N0UPC1_KALFE